VTPGALEWTINAYVLALASLIVVGGTLGDRYGRKRLFLVGLAVFTIFSVGCGLARSDTELIVHRALQGAGAAIMAPLSLSILVDAYPAERRTTAIGIWASVAGLGFLAGPIVGGLLIGRFGWPSVFFVNVPLAVVGFVVALGSVRESRDAGARSLDPVGTLLVTTGFFLLTFALIEAASPYAAAWPWYLLNGLGYGLLVPAVSSAGMSAIPVERSGVGSGILNSARQIGAAVGLAVLGSLSVAAAAGAWRSGLDGLPAAARAQAPGLVQQVAGAEAHAVAAVLGPPALEPALHAFMTGYRLALTVAGALLLVGAVIAFDTLRPRAMGASAAAR